MFVDVEDVYSAKKRYEIILADPPWKYNSRMAEGKGAKRSSSDDYYNTMTIDEIKKLKVKDILSKDSMLFIWGTWPKIREVFEVIDAWGFTYKTCAFVWVKRNKLYNEKRAMLRGGIDDFMGQGRWSRGNSEFCLLATKGKPKRLSADVRQIIYSPIRAHSQKPDEQYQLIERLNSCKNKIELFARKEFEGWDCFGDEIY